MKKGGRGQFIVNQTAAEGCLSWTTIGSEGSPFHSARTLALQRNPRQTGELCSRHSLSLDEHLEPFSHPFGVDQRLELQPRANTVRLGFALIVEVREFISLAEREQKCRLRCEPGSLQPRSLAPDFESGEIHVRGQVLLTRRSIIILRRAMILIREERAAHVMVVEKFRGAMTVVDREDVSALEAAPDFRDPVARFESGFRLLAFVKNDSLRREIFSDGATGKFRDVIHKSPVPESNENLFRRAALQDHAVNGQRVNQLIGEKTASGDVKWDLGGNGGVSRFRVLLQASCSLFAA